MKTKEKRIRLPEITALEGDTQTFLDTGDKPFCARCGNNKGMKKILTFIKFGMFEDTFTPVYHCKKCLENTSFTYTIEHEITEALK